MNDLSSTELKTLNTVSRLVNRSVYLGTLIQTMIGRLAESGTPVNAAEASINLALTGDVIHGETVTIGPDVYEFLADEAQEKSDPGNIAIDITAVTTKASQTLTVDTQPTSGDTMTIGSKVYTFVPVGTDTADGEVSIGADLAGAKLAIVAAINGTDGVNTAHAQVTAAAFAANDCVITAIVGGTAANSIVTTETFTAATNIFGAGTLSGGLDCAASDAVTALVTAVTASGTAGVSATDGAGDSVDFVADVAGAAGNDILVAETLSNGAFAGAADSLAGGVDGTVGYVEKPYVDETYLYICVANNTVSGKNWRRISLGSAY